MPGMWSLRPGRGGTADRWRPGAGREGGQHQGREKGGLRAPRDIFTVTGPAQGCAAWGGGYDGLPAAGVSAPGHKGLRSLPP